MAAQDAAQGRIISIVSWRRRCSHHAACLGVRENRTAVYPSGTVHAHAEQRRSSG